MNWLKKISARSCVPQGDYLYHITTMDNAYDIATGSLDPHSPDYGNDDNWAPQDVWPDRGGEERTYFGWSESGISDFAKDHRPVILRVSLSALKQLGIEYWTDGCDIFVRKSIPADVVETKQGTEWVPIKVLRKGIQI